MTQHFIWDIDPNILAFGPLQLRWYGLFFVGSFFLGLMLGHKMFQREGKDPLLLDSLLIYILMGTVIGARLAHCLFYEPEFYLSHPMEILKVWKGGLASHGGMAGVFVATYLFSKRYNLSYMWLLSRTTIPGALTSFFILGLPSDAPWAVVFSRVDLIARHPVQLYEAFAYLAIFFMLIAIYRKATLEFSTRFLPGFFLTTVFTVRFFLEYTKTKQEDYTIGLSLSTGQLLSLPVIVGGIVWIIWALRSTKRG
jgi:prolipoprotein diacylglyceryltransferase